jgi:hypothetical protein
MAPAPPEPPPVELPVVQEFPPVAIKEETAGSPPVTAAKVPAQPQVAQEEENDYLHRCVADITEQLVAIAPKSTPSVSAITLGGCKLLIATWEAEAFTNPHGEMSLALQRTVAARTILHVCMERQRRGEDTDLGLALDLAREQTKAMEAQVHLAKEAKDIDAAVNLAATTKRLLSLIEEGEKLLVP